MTNAYTNALENPKAYGHKEAWKVYAGLAKIARAYNLDSATALDMGTIAFNAWLEYDEFEQSLI